MQRAIKYILTGIYSFISHVLTVPETYGHQKSVYKILIYLLLKVSIYFCLNTTYA